MGFDPETGEVIESSDGRSVAEITTSGEVVDPTPAIRGDGQLSLDVGGDEPATATLSLSLGTVPTGREWSRGDTLRITLDVRVADVNFIEREDKYAGVFVERKHVAKLLDVVSVES